jgi:8-oxo-dGTP pyrophosphatase MutT (NUDIX family)
MKAQIYKIYINGTPLQLIPQDVDRPESTDSHLVTRYPGMAKMLLNYVDMLEKNPKFRLVTLYAPDVEKLFTDFKGHYKWLEAAGGLVYNEKGEILTIYRRGSWDLPKGKIDPGETPTQAGIREVREETGLNHLELGPELHITYHTYRLKNGKRVLKKTYWYRMDTTETDLVPQTEEDIEQAVWQSPRTFIADAKPVYGNILDVVMAGISHPGKG